MALHLLAPEEGILLLLPRRVFTKAKSWKSAAEPYLPVLPAGVTLRRSRAPLRWDPLKRVPVLILFHTVHRRRKRGIWLSPLLLQRTRGRPERALLLTSTARWLLLAPAPCHGPISEPPGSPTVRTLPFREAEKALSRTVPLLLLRLLGSPRLAPLLLGLYPASPRRKTGGGHLLPLLATVLAMGTAFLPGAHQAAVPGLAAPPLEATRPESAPVPPASENRLSQLWTLLAHMGQGEVEAIHLGNGLLTLRLRATDPFPLARELLELQPAASAVVEPPLGEAPGSVEFTVPVE